MNAATAEARQEMARIRARRLLAETAELILARGRGESLEEQTARIMALPPQQLADAVVALLDDGYCLRRLAAKYWEPQS